jgi:hypothetical protein
MMRAGDLIPAAMLALTVTAILCGAQLLPLGKTMLLVRVANEGTEAALTAAAEADAAFVSIPAPGFAILYGEASRVRGALDLAVLWKGTALCSPTS